MARRLLSRIKARSFPALDGRLNKQKILRSVSLDKCKLHNRNTIAHLSFRAKKKNINPCSFWASTWLRLWIHSKVHCLRSERKGSDKVSVEIMISVLLCNEVCKLYNNYKENLQKNVKKENLWNQVHGSVNKAIPLQYEEIHVTATRWKMKFFNEMGLFLWKIWFLDFFFI